MKVGLIGAGAIARRAHLPAWKKISPDIVKAIADVNLDLAKKVSEEFSIPNYTDDYKQVIKDKEISLIDIATPPQSHYEIIVAAIEEKKNILVEKPLVLTLDEALRIKHYVEKNKVQLTVIQNYRYYPCALRAKNRLDSGKIGQLLSIYGLAHSKFPSTWTRSTWLYHKGGVLYDFLPHLIDIINWFNRSKPKRVFSCGSNFTKKNMEFLTYAQIIIEYENGSVCSVDTSWLTGSNVLRLELHGTGGHIFLDIKENSFHEVHGTFTPLDSLRRFINESKSLLKRILDRSFFIGPIYYYLPFFEDFLNSLKSGTKPLVTLEEAIKTVAILEAAQRSLEKGEIINLDEMLPKI